MKIFFSKTPKAKYVGKQNMLVKYEYYESILLRSLMSCLVGPLGRSDYPRTGGTMALHDIVLIYTWLPNIAWHYTILHSITPNCTSLLDVEQYCWILCNVACNVQRLGSSNNAM